MASETGEDGRNRGPRDRKSLITSVTNRSLQEVQKSFLKGYSVGSRVGVLRFKVGGGAVRLPCGRKDAFAGFPTRADSDIGKPRRPPTCSSQQALKCAWRSSEGLGGRQKSTS